MEVAAIQSWVSQEHNKARLHVTPIRLSQAKEWKMNESGQICHHTGGFFSVKGIKAEWQFLGKEFRVSQVILHQPEIGILGLLVSPHGKGLKWLVQAKTEPGNVGGTQVAPTLQATESNYGARHGGQIPSFLSHFLTAKPENTLVNQLQSEQGSRFYKKRNRNMVVLVEESTLAPDSSWQWLSTHALAKAILTDHLVNTDCRSVWSGWAFSEYVNTYKDEKCTDAWNTFIASVMNDSEQSLHATELLEDELIALKKESCFQAALVSLADLEDWTIGQEGVFSPSHQDMSIRYYDVQCANREVQAWDQPLFASETKGFMGLVAVKHQGIWHVLLQARPEPGSFEGIEWTCTVQNNPGDPTEHNIRTWDSLVKELSLYKTVSGECSEEGGRFYSNINRYSLALVTDTNILSDQPGLRWVSLAQIRRWMRNHNLLTNELRTLLALFSAYLFCETISEPGT
jgi:oxidase EvaA